MFMLDYKEPGWRYLLATAVLLAWGVSGHPDGFVLAIGLTVIHLAHFMLRERSIKAFTVQVRFWYLQLLIVSFIEPTHWLYWIPTVGTWVRVTFGYCTMARCVSLLPWNRREPISIHLLRKTFLSRPVRGNIMQGLSSS